jgi:hypothetical protein
MFPNFIQSQRLRSIFLSPVEEVERKTCFAEILDRFIMANDFVQLSNGCGFYKTLFLLHKYHRPRRLGEADLVYVGLGNLWAIV